MSYLSQPRLHFAGVFMTNPSTVNNSACNYDPQVTSPDPSWNPDGPAFWKFQDCTVKSVVYADGSTNAADDPIIGASLASTDNPSSAKLVDLDPMQQLVSQIWGLQLQLSLASGNGQFTGNFQPVAFADLWQRAQSSQGDFALSAFYQSVLQKVSWSASLGSRFLRELKAAGGDSLSIKFMVDGYSMQRKNGRVVGTIGPALPDEPANFLLGRLLGPVDTRLFYFGSAQLDEGRCRVTLDLGNSLPTTTPGGPPSDVGKLRLAILPQGSDPVVLGEVRHSEDDYLNTALVQDFSLDPDQVELAKKTPLALQQQRTQGRRWRTVLLENADGLYVNAAPLVVRLNAGSSSQAAITAVRFGKPLEGQPVGLRFDSRPLQGPVACGKTLLPVGRPESALSFPDSVTTGPGGRAQVELKASDPGNPRQFIDGQVYGVAFTPSGSQDTQVTQRSTYFSVLVHTRFVGPASPTWDDVQPIFSQYAKLYPFMTKNIVDLADYDAVKQSAADIRSVMTLPPSDPRYMPVTRDLSRGKQKMIINWIDAGTPK